jgi:hypothetical protein
MLIVASRCAFARLKLQCQNEKSGESTVASEPKTKRNLVSVELPDYVEPFPTGAEDFEFLSAYLRIRSTTVRRALIALVKAIANSRMGSGTTN